MITKSAPIIPTVIKLPNANHARLKIDIRVITSIHRNTTRYKYLKLMHGHLQPNSKFFQGSAKIDVSSSDITDANSIKENSHETFNNAPSLLFQFCFVVCLFVCLFVCCFVGACR